MWGFPLSFMGEGWHNWSSFQIFILESLFNFLAVLVVFVLGYKLIEKYSIHFTIPKWLKLTSKVISCSSFYFFVGMLDHIILFLNGKRILNMKF
jgi:hypothetical protein